MTWRSLLGGAYFKIRKRKADVDETQRKRPVRTPVRLDSAHSYTRAHQPNLDPKSEAGYDAGSVSEGGGEGLRCFRRSFTPHNPAWSRLRRRRRRLFGFTTPISVCLSVSLSRICPAFPSLVFHRRCQYSVADFLAVALQIILLVFSCDALSFRVLLLGLVLLVLEL